MEESSCLAHPSQHERQPQQVDLSTQHHSEAQSKAAPITVHTLCILARLEDRSTDIISGFGVETSGDDDGLDGCHTRGQHKTLQPIRMSGVCPDSLQEHVRSSTTSRTSNVVKPNKEQLNAPYRHREP
jgi:hypothetical protein